MPGKSLHIAGLCQKGILTVMQVVAQTVDPACHNRFSEDAGFQGNVSETFIHAGHRNNIGGGEKGYTARLFAEKSAGVTQAQFNCEALDFPFL